MNTHCLIVQSLATGEMYAERVEPGVELSHQDQAEQMVEAMGLMPDERWRWGVIEVADPIWARHANPAIVDWHPGEFTQRVEESPEDTGT